MRLTNPVALSALAGVGIAGALVGCTSTETTTSGSGSGSGSGSNQESASTAAPSTDSGSSSTTFKDGTYTADGAYQSPSGDGRITVTLTLASGVVTAVKVAGHATDATAKAYQSAFEGGIAGKIVGKRIDSLKVTEVSGSSLTSGGFDQAVRKIEADASA